MQINRKLVKEASEACYRHINVLILVPNRYPKSVHNSFMFAKSGLIHSFYRRRRRLQLIPGKSIGNGISTVAAARPVNEMNDKHREPRN